jgi:hypothetical protein
MAGTVKDIALRMPMGALHGQEIVQASVHSRFMTEPFELVSQMQLAALEINDQQVISRVMEQGFGKLIFEGLEPPFKIRNIRWFRHECPRIHA